MMYPLVKNANDPWQPFRFPGALAYHTHSNHKPTGQVGYVLGYFCLCPCVAGPSWLPPHGTELLLKGGSLISQCE